MRKGKVVLQQLRSGVLPMGCSLSLLRRRCLCQKGRQPLVRPFLFCRSIGSHLQWWRPPGHPAAAAATNAVAAR